MLPYDVILFDVGEVLLTNGWDHRERAAAVEAFQLDKEEFERRHAELDDPWERGKITMADYLSYTVFISRAAFRKEILRNSFSTSPTCCPAAPLPYCANWPRVVSI